MPWLSVVSRHRLRPGPKMLCCDDDSCDCIELVYLVLKALNFGLVIGDMTVDLVLGNHGNEDDPGSFIAAEEPHPLGRLTLIAVECL